MPTTSRKPCSYSQHRQRQLAWATYILDGAAANLLHAARINSVTFTSEEHELLHNVFRDLERTSERLKEHMQAL